MAGISTNPSGRLRSSPGRENTRGPSPTVTESDTPACASSGVGSAGTGLPAISGAAAVPQQQLGLFQTVVDDGFRERLRAIDVNQLTPLAALQLLAELQRDAEN